MADGGWEENCSTYLENTFTYTDVNNLVKCPTKRIFNRTPLVTYSWINRHKQEQSHPAGQSELVEVTLPTYESIPRIPTVPHNNLEGRPFVELIDKAYNQIIRWRKNLFLVSSGNRGNELTGELAY